MTTPEREAVIEAMAAAIWKNRLLAAIPWESASPRDRADYRADAEAAYRAGSLAWKLHRG